MGNFLFYIGVIFFAIVLSWKVLASWNPYPSRRNFKYITAGLLLLAVLPLPNTYHIILFYFVGIASLICAIEAFDQLDMRPKVKVIPWIVAFGIIAFINGLAMPLSRVAPQLPESIFLPIFIDNEPNHWRVVFYVLAAVVFSLNAYIIKKDWYW